MTFLSSDQRELFLPLVEGIHESPPWGAFLRNLVARTHSRRAFLCVTMANAMADQPPPIIHVAAPRAAHEPPLDADRMDALQLHPIGTLRPGRVYMLDELLDFDNPAQLAIQRAGLDEMGIRFVRCLRVSAGGAADAWLVLVREREDFTAAAGATLSSIGPHLAAALHTLVALSETRLQAAMAQSALARLGVGEVAFDTGARVMAADPQAERLLAFHTDPGAPSVRRLQLLPEAARQLEAACAALASGPAEARHVLRIDERRALDLLLRPSDLTLSQPAALPAVIGTIRQTGDPSGHDNPARTARIIAALHGLSQREAALAHGLTLGETLMEAGARLHLTPETARNYSKRIYAKTGTSGQADLVRLLLTGLAPFA